MLVALCRGLRWAWGLLLGHLLLDVQEKLVVGERRLRPVLHQVLEEAGLGGSVVPDRTRQVDLHRQSNSDTLTEGRLSNSV